MKQTFLAEIKRVEAKKLASLDMEIRLTVATDETTVLDLGKIPSDQVVQVTVDSDYEDTF